MLTPRVINDCGGAQWQQRTENLPHPGGFSFFVLAVKCDWYIGDYLVGLTWAETDSCIYIAGTFDQLDSACYAFSKQDAPHDILVLYNYIHQKMTDFGYRPRGVKRPASGGFYLE